ncbi:MAG TPA: hypothetical protein VFW22_06925 [Pseudolabrys sp.]|nr:hypothetical protein [Pseudolabrys sp.]
MRLGAIIRAALVAAATGALVAWPAAAQEAAGEIVEMPLPPANPDDAANPQPETPLTAEEATALGNALNFDAADLVSAKPVKSLRLPGVAGAGKFDVSTKPDGAGTMSLYRPFGGDWDAKVGADLNPAPAQPDGYRPFPVVGASQDSGAAWASVGMANLAAVDARVDPANDQSKLGTTFKHSIPVGGKFALTLQNSYSVTQAIGPPVATPSAIPLMAAPAGTAAAAPQVWGNQKAVKFDVLSTGTTFGAGVTTASNDPNAHNTFSAEQKLYGPLQVTTAVTDFGQSTASKSIAARFKLTW